MRLGKAPRRYLRITRVKLVEVLIVSPIRPSGLAPFIRSTCIATCGLRGLIQIGSCIGGEVFALVYSGVMRPCACPSVTGIASLPNGVVFAIRELKMP